MSQELIGTRADALFEGLKLALSGTHGRELSIDALHSLVEIEVADWRLACREISGSSSYRQRLLISSIVKPVPEQSIDTPLELHEQ